MDLFRHFKFEPAGKVIAELDTPTPVIDLEKVERNLRRWQERCDSLGLENWPHIKTHKLVPLALAQLELGAAGLTVQKLSEAEVMAAAGIRKLLLTFNVLGRRKVERLAALAKTTDISVVADNETVVESVAAAGIAAGRQISVLVECDTGAHRNGVASPEEALHLAQKIDKQAGVSYGGLMTYPKPGLRAETHAFLAEAKQRAAAAGLETRRISTGGTPDMWSDEGLDGMTEYRAGTYIYNDRSLVERGTSTLVDCAVTVLATVVSRPSMTRVIIDAGSKALTSDLLGLRGYGVLADQGEVMVKELSEEHGIIELLQASKTPKVGDVVRILPNHVCPVSNLYDRVIIARGETVLGAVRVDARGCVQ